MSNIVAIVSSPRPKGNSGILVNSILDGAMGLSTNIINYYNLNSARSFTGCNACEGCKKSGKCVLNDGLTGVLEDIVHADVVIISTPVYFFGPSAQLKALIDRMYSFCVQGDKNPLKGKKAILVVTASSPEEAIKPIAAEISKVMQFIGFSVDETVVYSDKGGSASVVADTGKLDEMRQIGLHFRNT